MDRFSRDEWHEDAERKIVNLNLSSEAIFLDGLIDSKRNKIKISLVSRRTIFIITMILLLGLTAAEIVKNLCFSSSEESRSFSTEKPNDSNYTGIDVGSSNKTFLVGSAADLKELTADQDTITIRTLNEEYFESFAFNENKKVKNLKIHGPISPKWLRFVFQKFPGITTLIIDADGLCSVDMRDMHGFSFAGVVNFKLTNLFSCEDIGWISRSQFPGVQTLTITNSDLTEHNFKPILAFLTQNRQSISQIIVNKCFICKTCNFKGVPKGNRLHVKISGSKRIPKEYPLNSNSGSIGH